MINQDSDHQNTDFPHPPDEDESGFERDRDREPEIEVPFDPRKIDIIVKSMTVSSLHHRLQSAELDLTPDFQRQANVWDLKRKSRLIESILLRIPLPSFYFSEDDDGVYAVVDGLQRICAIFHFMDVGSLNKATGAKLNPLRLTGLQYLRELEGISFSELDRKFQRRVMEQEVTTNVIRAGTPVAVKFNVFARLNQGGMPLNAQEIRNAIFPGQWRRFIGELADHPIFRRVTEGKVRTERQQDMELVLRYVALLQLGRPFLRQPNQTLDEYLNHTVEHGLLKWSASKWNAVQADFLRALQAAERIFGRHAFRKITRSGFRSPINRGLFESELVVLSSLTDAQIEELYARRHSFLDRLMLSLEADSAFIQSLLYGTGSAEASNTRVTTLWQLAERTLHD